MPFLKITDPTDLANYYAKMSCTMWNRSVWEPKTKFGRAFKKAVIDKIYRLSRRYYRKKYQFMAQTAAESRGSRMQFWTDTIALSRGAVLPNTYPWPYVDRHFADWEESDEPEHYTLISDPSGCVVKYSTSYCAWKIYELTGKWPKRKTRIRMDAKNWLGFLNEAGYSVVMNMPSPGHHFVGIDPRAGEWGLTVWYEKSMPGGAVSVSSYVDKGYEVWTIKADDVLNKYIWVQID